MKSKLGLEVISLLITSLLAFFFVFPLYDYYGDGYRFYFSNLFFIFIFITYTRYIFLLKYTFIANAIWIKVVLVFVSIPLILYGVDRLLEFQVYLDEVGFVDISGNDIKEAGNYAFFAKTQYIFFATGSILVLLIFPLRMIVSVWRIVNKKGTV